VKNVESGFLAGSSAYPHAHVPRTRQQLEGCRLAAIHHTDRLADLYERELYSRVRDEKHGARRRYVRDLLIVPAGLPAGASFDPRCDNWRRAHKVPILVLNATTLNTGHNWQFTATFMGELRPRH